MLDKSGSDKRTRNDADPVVDPQRNAPGKAPRTSQLPAGGQPVQARAQNPAEPVQARSAGAWTDDGWMDAAVRGTAPQASAAQGGPGAVVQRQAETRQRGDNDPFRVDRGQLTFDAEGTEGGRFHTRTAHWPGGASGVTIGRGYDLGQHSRNQMVTDFAESGISAGVAGQFAGAIGLTGRNANNWLTANRASLPEITPEQQEALFNRTYAELAGDVERISGNYARTMSQRTGKDQAEFQIDWNRVHPAIRDVLVDLRYRGDYTPATRERVQAPAIANDLRALYQVMRDRAYWVDGRGVPLDRFNRRMQYLENALGSGNQQQGEQNNTEQGQQQGGQQQGSQAGPAKEYKVTATSLNVRSSPSSANAQNRIGSLSQDERVTGKSLGNGWVEISFKGQKAYVSAQFLEAVEAKKPQETQYTVTASSLNVRAAAAASSQRLGALPRGAKIKGTPLGNGWVEISFNDQKAFVSAEFLSTGNQTQGPQGGQPQGGQPQGGQQSGERRLSGAQWVSIANANGWVNNTAFSALDSSWGPKAEAFVSGLRAAGARVSITAGLRHPKRAALMHYAWGVAGGQYTPAQANAACQERGIAINWDHGNLAASRSAARALKSTFGMVHQASLTSNHIRGLAIDMSISGLPGRVTMNGKSYTTRAGASGTAAAQSAAPIGRDAGVLWYGTGDWVHWSQNGR